MAPRQLDDGSDDNTTDELTSITEVFADVLVANEDMIHAVSASQQDRDINSIAAYHRILHRNLMEMADFVDSIFGVFTIEGGGDDDNPARNPDQLRQALIERFGSEILQRKQKRSKFLRRKIRRQIRAEEGARSRMTDEAHREDNMAVSITASPTPTASDIQNEASTLKEGEINLAMRVADEDTTAPPTIAPPQSIPRVPPPYIGVMQSGTSPVIPTIASTSSTLTSVLHDDTSTLSTTLMHSTTTNDVQLAPTPPSGVSVPIRLPLPPATSNVQFFYPMPPQLLFANAYLSFACCECARQKVSVHECRNILNHTQPPPVLGSGLWPLTFPYSASAPSSVPRPLQATTRVPTPGTGFNRVCQECKSLHKSVHYCRKTVQHTAPGWERKQTTSITRQRNAQHTKAFAVSDQHG